LRKKETKRKYKLTEKDNEERVSRKSQSREWGSIEQFSQKQKTDSRMHSSRSRSRSRSYDMNLNSRKRNLFNQSFDSKLSEFSDNGELMILHKPTKIQEYFENSGNDKYNSLSKHIDKEKERKRMGSEDQCQMASNREGQPIKNFTFSKNKGGKRSVIFSEDEPKKMEIEVESPEPCRKKEMKLDHFDSEEEFNLSLPRSIKKAKKPKFELDLGLDENEEIIMKPPSLGNHKKFNMAGSSWGNIGFSLGTGQQKVLNAPRNNKKVSFTFGTEVLKQNLKENFKLSNKRNKFQPNLEIIIPEENSVDVEYESDDPTLELPSLKDRKSRKSTKNKRFNLNIEVEDSPPQEPRDKVVLIDEFHDSVSKQSSEETKSPLRRPNLIINQDKTNSNSPRHVSGINESLKSSSDKANWQAQPIKNLEIQFDTDLINQTMGNRGADLFAGCRTNPLPTTKNATQKYKGFGFGEKKKKKRHLTVSLTGGEMFTKNDNQKKKSECIDELSNEEVQSNSGEEKRSSGKLYKKRSLKMKINSKNSDLINKNFSKQSSKVINSIQSSGFFYFNF
jgi:hypothetical protein